MSKNNKKRSTNVTALDAFVNMLARTGYGMPNVENATAYPITRLTQNYVLLMSMYRDNWLVGKIIDLVAEDMTKAWIDISSEMTPEMQDALDKLERNSLTRAKVTEGLKWGRLFGGAAGLMLIDGVSEDDLMEPLDINSILPDSFKGIMVVDRWAGVYPDIELVEDIGSTEFGKPKYYEITDITRNKTFMVHHSRVLRFEGRLLPAWEQMSTQGWGASEIEMAYEEIRKRDNTSANLAGLIFRANINVRKMAGLDLFTGMADAQTQTDLYYTLEQQNALMNNFSTQVIGENDDFVSLQNQTFAGLNDVYESFMLDVSGATGIPVTKLFGRSPGGLNATGENDLQNYYDMIASKQETYLRPVLEKLLPIMFMSQFGYVPDDINFRFNPVRTPSEKDVAELVDKKARTIVDVHAEGLLSDKTAMKELQEMGKTTGMFTNITDEDIAKADEAFGAGELPMMGENPFKEKKAIGDAAAFDGETTSDRLVVKLISDLHKKLGYESENPPCMVAHQEHNSECWAQIWATGMDWNSYWYQVDSKHDEPRLIAYTEDFGRKPLVVKEGPKEFNGENKYPNKIWQETVDNWVSNNLSKYEKKRLESKGDAP